MKNCTKCCVYLLFICVICLINGATRPVLAQNSQPHVVQPGDSWLALSLRFQVSQAELQTLNPLVNPGRQPTIGTTIQLPPTNQAERPGRLVRPTGETLFSVAFRSGQNPWQLALQNGLRSPYQPLLYTPIVLPNPAATIREYPAGLNQLELSAVPARPGEGLAVWGELPLSTSWPLTGTVTLGTATGEWLRPGGENQWLGLIGTGAFYRPGEPELTIFVPGQPRWAQPWLVAPKEWTYSDLTLTGTAAEITAEARRVEREQLLALWGQTTPQPLWDTPFREPITDYLEYTALYGARRSYNGGPYDTYHEGLDFSAYGGTPVYAPAGGMVVLAQPLYVRGGAVIIDHGLGVYSGLYHLSEVIAQPGQAVQPGDLVGKVGTTGFSTGNHLHWDLLVQGVWVDPQAWQVQNVGCWILLKLGRVAGACATP